MLPLEDFRPDERVPDDFRLDEPLRDERLLVDFFAEDERLLEDFFADEERPPERRFFAVDERDDDLRAGLFRAVLFFAAPERDDDERFFAVLLFFALLFFAVLDFFALLVFFAAFFGGPPPPSRALFNAIAMACFCAFFRLAGLLRPMEPFLSYECISLRMLLLIVPRLEPFFKGMMLLLSWEPMAHRAIARIVFTRRECYARCRRITIVRAAQNASVGSYDERPRDHREPADAAQRGL